MINTLIFTGLLAAMCAVALTGFLTAFLLSVKATYSAAGDEWLKAIALLFLGGALFGAAIAAMNLIYNFGHKGGFF